MTSTAPADRLREAAAVLATVDQYLAHAIAVLPESITDHQWDSVAEIPTGIRRALAAWLELEADVIAARAAQDDGPEHAVDTGGDHALAVADAILGEAVSP